MQIDTTPLAPGLYFVSTPIGAARDITLRALDVLASADILAAEDTRTLKHLMQIHGVALGDRRVVAYHEHSGPAQRDKLVAEIAAGRSVAYASEAGTPLVADPGFQLARAAIAAGLPVIAAPGPSAVLTALTVSGLPSDRFLFAGFPPPAKGARAGFLRDLSTLTATVILYESPKRVQRLLTELAEIFGPDRAAVVCRELTKRFEEVCRGTLAELAAEFDDRTVKGEIVVLIDRAPEAVADAATLDDALREALSRLRVKDAAAEVAEQLGLPRRQVYQRALELGRAE
ncbi:16S rRNA (cytidine(1402)-2'-O)-methyltransferase [Actibacterium ureilyticum]|uniref:16S rRNA (cytidine(1402)-2'-O)-methyltransferase n=1 Tax=Actibacterium ureilyticum TaxID=1590614 RepID=UPI000BAA9782|nr:16S rRNA (cytidine(1402)-2'-O)-methyltransferase [Actibacterium ureilyticum]